MQTLLLLLFVGFTCLVWVLVIAASQLAKAAELIDETNNRENE